MTTHLPSYRGLDERIAARGSDSIWIGDKVQLRAREPQDADAFIASVFAKSFFLAKVSYEYTMNYLRHEKCLRDHGASCVGLWRAASAYGGLRRPMASCVGI